MTNHNALRGFYSPRAGTIAHAANLQFGGLEVTGPATVGGAPILTRRYAMGAPQAGDTVANTTTETAFASAYPVPANDMTVGRFYRLLASGIYSVNAAGPRLNVRVKLGATELVVDGPVFGATARSNRPWRLEALITVLSSGASGSVRASGAGRLFTSANSPFEFELFTVGAITVDTTVAQTLGLTATWNIAATANSVTQQQLTVDAG
jgi:hypothetical protein